MSLRTSFAITKPKRMPKTTFELTIILVPDKKSGHYSAFFAQFPEAIASGKTEQEAQLNLFDIFRVMLEDKKQEILKSSHLEDDQYISKSANLTLA